MALQLKKKEAGEDTEILTHKYYKNWEGSTPAVEADIQIEGFTKSFEMHGIHYTTVIGDGDSSVHKKLQENVEYGYKIKKSEYANHVTRNYCSKLLTSQASQRRIDYAEGSLHGKSIE